MLGLLLGALTVIALKEHGRARRLERQLAWSDEGGLQQLMDESSEQVASASDAADFSGSIRSVGDTGVDDEASDNSSNDSEAEYSAAGDEQLQDNTDAADEEDAESAEGDRPELPPEQAVPLALAAAARAAAAAASAALQLQSSVAAKTASGAAGKTHSAAVSAAGRHKGSAAEALQALLQAARDKSADAAAAAARGKPYSVHVAAAAAAVSTAAAEGAKNRPEVAEAAAVRAATAVHKAAAAERTQKRAGTQDSGITPGATLQGRDLVHVTFTTAGRHALAASSRTWRKPLGIRAVVVTNVNATEYDQAELDENGETWTSYPDVFGKEEVTYYPGDYRGAMTPLIAHRLLEGDYKWLIYGDDDTIFFPEGIARALETHHLDADMPYFVSDSQWGFGVDDDPDPAEWNPRCVPCDFDPGDQDESVAPVPPLRGCPCNTTAICKHWQQHLPGKVFKSCTKASLRVPSPAWLGIHGDAGALLSVGLMRQLDPDTFEQCLMNITAYAGGDNKISRCIWAAGFGLTDPGYSYLSGNILENYIFDRYTLRIGGDASSMARLLQDKLLTWRHTGFCAPGANAARQHCLVPDKEDEMLTSMVSTHHGAQTAETAEQAASAMELLSAVYRMYMNRLHEVYPQVWKMKLVVGSGGK